LGKIKQARTHKVRALVGMKDIIKKRRCLSHRRYVEHRMAQLQTEIFNDAMATGVVNLEKRKQLLKYRTHLNNL
jgi:hypothetical protein